MHELLLESLYLSLVFQLTVVHKTFALRKKSFKNTQIYVCMLFTENLKALVLIIFLF